LLEGAVTLSKIKILAAFVLNLSLVSER